MRGLLLVVLVSCTWSSTGDDMSGDPSDPGTPIRGHSGCSTDRACSGDQLCARTGACLPPSQIRAVHAIWTVRGAPADQTTCSPSPDFEIDFRATDSEAQLGYAPVPCEQGKFTIDKLPTSFTEVGLGHRGKVDMATIDAETGNAVFDLAL